MIGIIHKVAGRIKIISEMLRPLFLLQLLKEGLSYVVGVCGLSLLFSDSEYRIDIMKSMMSSGDNDVGVNESNFSDF